MHKRDWENFEQNNESIVLNVFFTSKDSEKITLLYKSEYNLERENKVLLLMINDDHNEKYYYFAVKSKLELCSSEWLRSKKESIITEDNCFQNALNDSLEYQTIKTHPERISKLKSYINQYNWKDIKFPSDKEDCPHNKKEIEPEYTSKYNYKRKTQVILLIITDDDNRWRYLAVKSLPALFRGITSSNNGDFYCFNCFHSYRTLNKLKKHEKVVIIMIIVAQTSLKNMKK